MACGFKALVGRGSTLPRKGFCAKSGRGIAGGDSDCRTELRVWVQGPGRLGDRALDVAAAAMGLFWGSAPRWSRAADGWAT
jgi:hypothetical protein